MTYQLVMYHLIGLSVAQDVIEINKQQLNFGENELQKQMKSHPNVIDDYFPNRDKLDAYNKYRISYPDAEDYSIGLIVNPCGVNGTHGNDGLNIPLNYDCCMDRYGSGEYGYLKYHQSHQNGEVAMNTLQIFERRIPADPDEVMHNMITVDEYGVEIPYEYSRRANDITMIDESCRGLRDPHPSCLRERLHAAKSPVAPSCWDYNQTVDSTLSCYDPNGTRKPNCMQVAYSQNAFIHVCGGEFINDDHCGTYIEIHRPNGSYSDAEDVVIADTQIITRKTNGMRTTTISLTYKGNTDKVLCAYSETKIRIGSLVRIKSNSPACCCPPTYNRSNKKGSFFCPKDAQTEDGPFARTDDTPIGFLQRDLNNDIYPYCHYMEETKDILMCSREIGWGQELEPAIRKTFLGSGEMYYTAPCSMLEIDDNGTYFSGDLSGEYESVCPFGEAFKGCGMLSTECIADDSRHSFSEKIGKVVRLPDKDDDESRPTYGISFNDGRTVYDFQGHHLSLEEPRSNYELWFVQRNRFEKILQKKKGFRVVWPECMFDVVNDRYFPYAHIPSELDSPQL